MTTVLLDTHAILWFSSDPDQMSPVARRAAAGADTLAVAGISWYELAWLAGHGRISLAIPARSWVERVAERVLTIGVTPGIASTAAALPDSFPRDPADRLIYATAIEHGWQLVTKDKRMRAHPFPRQITVW